MKASDIARALDCRNGPDSSGNYQCKCPGSLHRNGDRTPSLSVKDGRDRVLLFCFAGCTYADIAGALESRGIFLKERT